MDGFVAFSVSRVTIAISDQTALFLELTLRCLEPDDGAFLNRRQARSGTAAGAVPGPCAAHANSPPPAGSPSPPTEGAAHFAEPSPSPLTLAGPSSAIAPVDIFTQDKLRDMANPRIGGKAACQKQRELRGRLLATADVREVDLTVSDFDWKAVLKSLPAGADVFGTGVCKLISRLLRDVRDPGYIKLGSGERHVFEVTRTDGSAVHLHFHKQTISVTNPSSLRQFLSRSVLENLIV